MPANVVGVPVVVEVLSLALITALVTPVAPTVGAALAQVNGWGGWLVALRARAFGGVPGAQITSPAAAARYRLREGTGWPAADDPVSRARKRLPVTAPRLPQA